MKLISIINNFEGRSEELGLKIEPIKPIFHIKPDTAMLRNNDPFFIPHFSDSIVAECEVVVKISRVVKSIEERFSPRCYNEIGLAVSFTADEIQREAIKCGLPWEEARSYDKSTAISLNFLDVNELGDAMNDLSFEMSVDSKVAQSAKLSDMLFSIDKIISYVSQSTTLKIGDLILCGTTICPPHIKRGEVITARLGQSELLNFEIR